MFPSDPKANIYSSHVQQISVFDVTVAYNTSNSLPVSNLPKFLRRWSVYSVDKIVVLDRSSEVFTFHL